MSADEPNTPDEPDEPAPTGELFAVRATAATQCFTCHGNGAIYQHVATASGHPAGVQRTCPQCHGNRFLPGLQAPM